MKPIADIAESLGLKAENLELYGAYKAKVLSPPPAEPRGKLVMVTAMTPTPAGEGKTTTAIGLTDALRRLGKKAVVALREPSLGPVFGLKGGATGGGAARVVPSDDINLHFTGDMHAVTAAHNLLAAMVDNRIHFDGACGLIDCRTVTWGRVLDMDDRVLRDIVVGIGGPLRGIARETSFDITAASEVMAILCLARDAADLRERLGSILVGYDVQGKPVFARDVKAQGAMAALLRDAVRPNLVQTLEGAPAFIHGGPFANIAHGTNSVIATRLALGLGDIVVTETGFASDLGAEKFFDIVVRTGAVPPPAACVLVATMRALKYHGGVKSVDLAKENVSAVEKGFENLDKHIENMEIFGVPFVVALNKFPTDTEAEIERLTTLCRKRKARFAVSDVFARGGEGGEELAHRTLEAMKEKSRFAFLYPLDRPLIEKIETVARRVYGAKRVDMEGKIRRRLLKLEKDGFGGLPVCVAKTQNSLSDDSEALGRPLDFTLIVTDAQVSAGAGFVVVLCGDIMTMPGLPKSPSAERIDVGSDGRITGISG
ncbi:MAG: formate--tetrahydrofolate ligase [Candidatus Aminicenantes bacterium]|nr:formate--tetrahydrofolate ligase [Candidatus Aminicenantes bacterium]